MTREIPLTRGAVALVDDEDYDFLIQWKWRVTDHGYAVRFETIPLEKRKTSQRQRVIYMHHVVLGIVGRTDHINRNPSDNRRKNLRLATQQQNNMNRGKSANKTSQYIGVCYFKQTGKWTAYISVDRKRKHLGCFATEIEAAKARDLVAYEQYGEFALLNLPEEQR